FKFLDALDSQFRGLVSRRGLDEDSAKPEPAFDDVGLEVNVLDARVIDDGFATKKNSPTHRNAVAAEPVPHRVITEIHHDDDDRKERERGQTEQHVILPKSSVRSFDGLNAQISSRVGHDRELTCIAGVAQEFKGPRAGSSATRARK